MKIKLDCKAVPPGPAGNSRPRLIFTGAVWDTWDHTFCVHGEKLRWTCDECDEHFEANPADIPNTSVTDAQLKASDAGPGSHAHSV